MAWTHDSENPQIRNGEVSPTPNVAGIRQVEIAMFRDKKIREPPL
jgi:hypothetical protein